MPSACPKFRKLQWLIELTKSRLKMEWSDLTSWRWTTDWWIAYLKDLRWCSGWLNWDSLTFAELSPAWLMVCLPDRQFWESLWLWVMSRVESRLAPGSPAALGQPWWTDLTARQRTFQMPAEKYLQVLLSS